MAHGIRLKDEATEAIISVVRNSNTAERVYTLPDITGQILTNNGVVTDDIEIDGDVEGHALHLGNIQPFGEIEIVSNESMRLLTSFLSEPTELYYTDIQTTTNSIELEVKLKSNNNTVFGIIISQTNGIQFIGLPTSDPGGTNKVWSDAGTLKIT